MPKVLSLRPKYVSAITRKATLSSRLEEEEEVCMKYLFPQYVHTKKRSMVMSGSGSAIQSQSAG